MDEMSVEKWWNEICGRGNREKPVKNLPRPRFVHHETHMEGPRRELGTPAVGGERLTAYNVKMKIVHTGKKMMTEKCIFQYKIQIRQLERIKDS